MPMVLKIRNEFSELVQSRTEASTPRSSLNTAVQNRGLNTAVQSRGLNTAVQSRGILDTLASKAADGALLSLLLR